MSKVYILQKDLPNAKAGTRFEFSFEANWCHYKAIGTNGKDVCYDQSLVESPSNSSWFLPEENKSNDSFQWTDELALEFLNAHRTSDQIISKFYWKKESVEAFKYSKEKEISFTGIPPKPQAENKPDWEIKTFINKKGDHTWEYDKERDEYVGSRHGARFCLNALLGNPPDGRASVANGDIKIHSVKRLSDGEVFSVGDEVEMLGNSHVDVVIDSFYITADNEMCCLILGGVQDKYTIDKLNHFKKPQPQKEEQRIEVEIITFYGSRKELHVFISKDLPQGKLEAMKNAIEQVLNDDKHLFSDRPIFTPKQYEEHGERCFNAGRERVGGWWNNPVKNWLYSSYQHFKSNIDYKKSKQ